jgi:hypothetical protein
LTEQKGSINVQRQTATDVTSLRRPGLVWAIGAVSAALILISTLDFGWFQNRLVLRAALMAAGMIPAAFVLARLAPGGVIDHRNRRRFLLAVLVVHILATLYFFPLSDALNDRPVVTLDHSFHYYQAYRAREVFWETFRIDCYDPYFMAGYPGGTIFDLDMKGAGTFCSVFPFVGVARTLKLFILCAYLTLIPVLYWGSRKQGFRIEESMLGLLAFLAFWHWGRPYAGDFRYAGMFAFVFATHLCFLNVGLLRQVARRKLVKTFFGLGPVAFLIHPTAAVMLPVPFAFSIGIDQRRWRSRSWMLLVGWCVAVVIINMMWLKPFFQYVWLKTTTELYYQIEGWEGLVRLLLKPTCAIALGMMALAVIGMVRLSRQGRLTTGLPTGAAALFLFFIAGWGVYLPGIDQLEPGRFLLSAFVFLTPLAGVGLHALIDAITATVRRGRVGHALRSTVVVSMALISLPLSLLETKSFYRHTITTSLKPDVASMVEEVSARIRLPGRLMIEDTHAIHYGDVHLPALLPLTTGVEQIGGPYPHTFLLYHFTSFRWEATFGRSMDRWDRESLQTYLALYDVRWILTATARTRDVITGIAGRPPDWSQAPYAMWTLDPPPGAAQADGAAVVESGLNRLVVHGDADSDGYFIHYHWVPGLEASGVARIRPVHRYDDPVPFIYVEPNGEGIVIITY